MNTSFILGISTTGIDTIAHREGDSAGYSYGGGANNASRKYKRYEMSTNICYAILYTTLIKI